MLPWVWDDIYLALFIDKISDPSSAPTSEASIIQDAIFQPELLALNPESDQKSSFCLDFKCHGRFQSTFWIEIQSSTGWYISPVDCSGDSGFLWELVGIISGWFSVILLCRMLYTVLTYPKQNMNQAMYISSTICTILGSLLFERFRLWNAQKGGLHKLVII